MKPSDRIREIAVKIEKIVKDDGGDLNDPLIMIVAITNYLDEEYRKVELE